MIYLRRFIYSFFGLLHMYFPLRPGIYVLCYHSISSDGWRFSNTQKEFEKHLSYIREKYCFITPAECMEYIKNGKTPSKPSFLLTFDDGYRNILPIKSLLKKHSVKPLLFLLGPETSINRQNLDSDLPLLNKDDVKSLLEDKWVIGSHSMTHCPLESLNQEKLIKECAESKNYLEKTYGISIETFAFPKGAYSDEYISALKKTGYTFAFSMDDELIDRKANRYTIPRIGIDGSHSFLEFQGTITRPAIGLRKFIRRSLQIPL